jgi:hypothetical protein
LAFLRFFDLEDCIAHARPFGFCRCRELNKPRQFSHASDFFGCRFAYYRL